MFNPLNLICFILCFVKIVPIYFILVIYLTWIIIICILFFMIFYGRVILCWIKLIVLEQNEYCIHWDLFLLRFGQTNIPIQIYKKKQQLTIQHQKYCIRINDNSIKIEYLKSKRNAGTLRQNFAKLFADDFIELFNWDGIGKNKFAIKNRVFISHILYGLCFFFWKLFILWERGVVLRHVESKHYSKVTILISFGRWQS